MVSIDSIMLCKHPAKRADGALDSYIDEEGSMGAYTARGFLVQSVSSNILNIKLFIFMYMSICLHVFLGTNCKLGALKDQRPHWIKGAYFVRFKLYFKRRFFIG